MTDFHKSNVVRSIMTQEELNFVLDAVKKAYSDGFNEGFSKGKENFIYTSPYTSHIIYDTRPIQNTTDRPITDEKITIS